MWGIYMGKGLTWKTARATWKGGDGVGAGVEKGYGGSDPQGGHGYVCEGVWLCQGEEREPLDARDQTLVFLLAVSFP
jgi:hypothetical protein